MAWFLTARADNFLKRHAAFYSNSSIVIVGMTFGAVFAIMEYLIVGALAFLIDPPKIKSGSA